MEMASIPKKKGAVIRYDARTPTKAVATCAIEFRTKDKNFVFAYALCSH